MKKAIFILIAIIAAFFLAANLDYVNEFVTAMQGGALIPLVIAVVVMLGRYIVQAVSYDEAFAAVGYRTGLWHNIVLIFSLVFINTFCPFGGATGVAFIIDDARRRGAEIGIATSGAVLSQLAFFAAVFIISIIGFFAMFLSGMVNPIFIIGGLVLLGTLLALSSFFFMGYFKPEWLFKIFDKVEGLARKILVVFKKDLAENWGKGVADSFVRSAKTLAENPKGALITILYASASALLNMMCLMAVCFAFGFTTIGPIVAAFSVATIPVLLSPTPQGVGVVEAVIIAILTSAGCSLSVATAIALVYRGILFWIPFVIGAVLLSQSGFFSENKNASPEAKRNDVGWIAGMLVLICAVVNLIIALVPDLFAPFSLVTQWVDIGNMFAGPALIFTAVLLVVLGVGLVRRYRLAWAATLPLLSFIAGFEFLFLDTIKVAIPILLIALFLFWKRDAFNRVISADIEAFKHRNDPKLPVEGEGEEQQALAASTEEGEKETIQVPLAGKSEHDKQAELKATAETAAEDAEAVEEAIAAEEALAAAEKVAAGKPSLDNLPDTTPRGKHARTEDSTLQTVPEI